MQDSYTARFDEYITLFKDIEFLSELSVTTNITHHLYILNLICKNHFEIYSSLLGVSILYEQNQDRWKLTWVRKSLIIIHFLEFFSKNMVKFVIL